MEIAQRNIQSRKDYGDKKSEESDSTHKRRKIRLMRIVVHCDEIFCKQARQNYCKRRSVNNNSHSALVQLRYKYVGTLGSFYLREQGGFFRLKIALKIFTADYSIERYVLQFIGHACDGITVSLICKVAKADIGVASVSHGHHNGFKRG